MRPDLQLALIGYGLAGRVFHAPLIQHTPGWRCTASSVHNATPCCVRSAMCTCVPRRSRYSMIRPWMP